MVNLNECKSMSVAEFEAMRDNTQWYEAEYVSDGNMYWFTFIMDDGLHKLGPFTKNGIEVTK